MTVKTGASWSGTFVTLSATGAVTAATGTPVGALYVDGTANGAGVTVTGANPYKWTVTLPALAAGQRVDMYITATVSAVATGGIVASEQADTELVSDLSDEVIGTGAGLTAVPWNAAWDTEVESEVTDGLTAYGAGTGVALTAQEVRDAMKLAPTAGSPSAGSVDKHLDDIPTTAAPTAAQIDTQLSGTHGAGAWGGAAGSGSVEWAYVVTDDNDDPIPDAFVYVTAHDSALLLASGYTDETGTVVFMLDAGEYDFYTRKGGYNFTNPDQETVA